MKNQQQLPKDGRASRSVCAASFNSLSRALCGPLQAPDSRYVSKERCLRNGKELSPHPRTWKTFSSVCFIFLSWLLSERVVKRVPSKRQMSTCLKNIDQIKTWKGEKVRSSGTGAYTTELIVSRESDRARFLLAEVDSVSFTQLWEMSHRESSDLQVWLIEVLYQRLQIKDERLTASSVLFYIFMTWRHPNVSFRMLFLPKLNRI